MPLSNNPEVLLSRVYYPMSYTYQKPLHTRRYKAYIARERKTLRRGIGGVCITLLISILACGVFVWVLGRAIDTHINNQDTMLCQSARVSHNAEYLKRCECYYTTQDITCMRGEVNR